MYFVLYTACYILYSRFYILYTKYYILYSIYCIRHTVYYARHYTLESLFILLCSILVFAPCRSMWHVSSTHGLELPDCSTKLVQPSTQAGTTRGLCRAVAAVVKMGCCNKLQAIFSKSIAPVERQVKCSRWRPIPFNAATFWRKGSLTLCRTRMLSRGHGRRSRTRHLHQSG